MQIQAGNEVCFTRRVSESAGNVTIADPYFYWHIISMGTIGEVVEVSKNSILVKIPHPDSSEERGLLVRLYDEARTAIEPLSSVSGLAERKSQYPWLTATFSGKYNPLFDLTPEEARAIDEMWPEEPLPK